jgi:inosine-uridine nucleoside N-ribohydrolase
MLNIIIDTDVGYDDLLAILYLMNCPDITIEAFTVVNGISTVMEGANAL